MDWTVADVAAATGGEAMMGDPGAVIHDVAIDSRLVRSGALFVALVAGRDGHHYIAAATAAGAKAVVVDKGRAPGDVADVAVVEVADTAVALLDLGRAARRRLRAPVIAITGSVGKTTTKDLMAAALARRWRTTWSEKSFNNELGVPLTLTNASEDTELAVIEMGARGPGHIAKLCDVARPTVAVVTAVAAVHTELFGSLEAIARAKGELVEALAPRGLAVLNGDDRAVAAMAVRAHPSVDVLRYSALGDPRADVAATEVLVDDDLHPSFFLRSPWGSSEVRLTVRGAHQVGNALAAAAVALRHEVPVDDVAAALATALPSPWRMALDRTLGGASVLNDAYNANPTSMDAALRSLARLPATRRVAVLGEMAELGTLAREAHLKVAALAETLGIEIIVVGTPLYGRPGVADVSAAVEALVSEGPLGPGDAVLIKASRASRLEGLADILLGRSG